MNQSVLFSDELRWQEQSRSIEFSAQCMGALIECVISAPMLEKLSGTKVVDAESATAAFERCRFDIEELAEQMIEEEEYDQTGRVVLN